MAESIHAAGGGLEFTATAEWDLSNMQYRFVHVGGSDNYVKVASQAGIKCIGILQNKPSSGQPARVRTHGISKLVFGSAVTRNDNIDTLAQGYGRTAVGSNINCIALDTVVASGTGKVLLTPHVAL